MSLHDDDDDGLEDYPALMTTPGVMTTRKQIVAFVHNMHGYLNVPPDRDKAIDAFDAHAGKHGLETKTTIEIEDHQQDSNDRHNWTVKTVAKIPRTHETVTCTYGSI